MISKSQVLSNSPSTNESLNRNLQTQLLLSLSNSPTQNIPTMFCPFPTESKPLFFSLIHPLLLLALRQPFVSPPFASSVPRESLLVRPHVGNSTTVGLWLVIGQRLWSAFVKLTTCSEPQKLPLTPPSIFYVLQSQDYTHASLKRKRMCISGLLLLQQQQQLLLLLLLQ